MKATRCFTFEILYLADWCRLFKTARYKNKSETASPVPNLTTRGGVHLPNLLWIVKSWVLARHCPTWADFLLYSDRLGAFSRHEHRQDRRSVADASRDSYEWF